MPYRRKKRVQKKKPTLKGLKMAISRIAHKPELKRLDFSQSLAMPNATWVVNSNLTNCVQGTTQQTRIGDKIKLAYLRFRYSILQTVQYADGTQRPICRVIFFKSSVTNNTGVGVTDLLGSTTSINALYNSDETGVGSKYANNILFDKAELMPQPTIWVNGVTDRQTNSMTLPTVHTIPLNGSVVSYSANNGVIADINYGHVGIAYNTSSNAIAPYLVIEVQIFFVDS